MTKCQLCITKCQLCMTKCQLCITKCQLCITDMCQLCINMCQLCIINFVSLSASMVLTNECPWVSNILCVTKCQHTVSQNIVCHQMSICSEQKCQQTMSPSVNTVHITKCQQWSRSHLSFRLWWRAHVQGRHWEQEGRKSQVAIPTPRLSTDKHIESETFHRLTRGL